MRTTVTLDPDVERLIRSAMKESSLSFRETLNQAVRKGLSSKRPQASAKFTQKTFRMGRIQSFRWEKALGVVETMEDAVLERKLRRALRR